MGITNFTGTFQLNIKNCVNFELECYYQDSSMEDQVTVSVSKNCLNGSNPVVTIGPVAVNEEAADQQLLLVLQDQNTDLPPSVVTIHFTQLTSGLWTTTMSTKGPGGQCSPSDTKKPCWPLVLQLVDQSTALNIPGGWSFALTMNSYYMAATPCHSGACVNKGDQFTVTLPCPFNDCTS